MTQRDRVLRALQKGPVNSVDFQIPVCDGGKPILRVAARIHDLVEDGFKISSKRRMNNTVDYILAGASSGQDDAAARARTRTGEARPGTAPPPPEGGRVELFHLHPYTDRHAYRDVS